MATCVTRRHFTHSGHSGALHTGTLPGHYPPLYCTPHTPRHSAKSQYSAYSVALRGAPRRSAVLRALHGTLRYSTALHAPTGSAGIEKLKPNVPKTVHSAADNRPGLCQRCGHRALA
eukprot:gene12035-biopygen12415